MPNFTEIKKKLFVDRRTYARMYVRTDIIRDWLY